MLSGPTPDSSEQVLSITHGVVAIGGRPILRDVSLAVSRGEFVAIMGANGSGKSTLIRSVVGLRALVSGSVRLFGTPLSAFHDWTRVGYVPQRASATSGVPASVWEIVASGRLAKRRLFRPLSRADKAAVTDALEVVGLAHRHRDGLSTLSGGQQQRVLIARALAGEPDLLFLDEPTAGVDLPNQEILAQTLGLLQRRGATIVLVAHELGPLAPLVDRSVVMRDGKIAYDGRPLRDHEVHHPLLAEAHTHHHHPRADAEDRTHSPHFGSPFDSKGGERG